ncbi:MAG: restriction endonuclease subunit S [Bacteroidales bacterium]|nr:restriction endonuclease subunit S [Bacteroidales bacterium]
MNALNTIKFSQLQQWDIKRLVQSHFHSKLPISSLGGHIIEQNQKYYISESDQQYGILGVNNKIGIFDAYIEKGSNIHQKYKKMDDGWIAYNPYRINVGSIGIKYRKHQYEYISPAYVVFSCTSDLLPEYLFLLMKTPSFNKIIRENTTGSVRQNLSFKTLQKLRLPLPKTSIQNELVSKYNLTIAEALEKERRIVELEKEINQYLQSEFGIRYAKGSIETGLNYKRFTDTDRWDLWNATTDYFPDKHNRISLKNVISLKSGTFLPAAEQIGTTYHVYGGNGITGSHDKYNYCGKRIIIGRVGEYCGNVHLVDGYYWVTDNAFIVDKKLEEVSWEYLEIAISYLNLNTHKTVSAQPSLSQSRILQQQINIPPADVQSIITSHILERRQQIMILEQQASDLRKKALSDFENEIFE